MTTGRAELLETPIGRFRFRHVDDRLFAGFTEVEISRGQRVLLARPEKALIDLLYLTPASDGRAYLRELRLDLPDDFSRRSTAREYLQARILEALQDHGAFTNWAFLGGTALRFLYGLPRYSEDLRFSSGAAISTSSREK